MTPKEPKSDSGPENEGAAYRLQRRRQRREERASRRQDEPEKPPRESARPRPNKKRVAPGPAPNRTPYRFPEGSIDEAADKVVRRLTRSGYEAYLVGGCVRDLLVGQRPKDFDVATNARPEQVRALFRNSRIIGRRFRLVHVLFSAGHIIETATFRKNPPPTSQSDPDDLLIRSDNVFGEAHEDALRRDFTINGMFYDLEDEVVLDWVGGLQHIDSRTVHTIGDPVVRFQEDPVRMLRAVKFAARIDFGMSPEVYEAIVQCRGTLAMAARPRLSEEVLRLMRGGASCRSIWLLWELGMLDILLPELSAFIADSPDDDLVWKSLIEIDRLVKMSGSPPDDVVLWTMLLLEPMLEVCGEAKDRIGVAHDFLEPVIERLNVPRRISDSVRRIVAMLPRLEQGKAQRFKKSALYPHAAQVMELRQAALGTRRKVNRPSRVPTQEHQSLGVAESSPSGPSPRSRKAPRRAPRIKR